MVLIESKKYACETCIKGHRSSGCKHTDRPLYEIKKKGRPVTQCEHCRELRKTKQVHVKCSCYKEELPVIGGEKASSRSKKGVNKMLDSATFPDGLPEALEASVASQLLSQGAASDSDHERCSCLSTGSECNCCTLRKAIPQARKTGTLDDPLVSPPLRSSHSPNPASSSTIPARVPELRALLPKPPHDPSSSALHSIARHESKLYSPYGRAYDQSHPNHPTYHITSSPAANVPQISLHSSAPSSSSNMVFPDRGASSSSAYPLFHTSHGQALKSVGAFGVADHPTVGSHCACGVSCTCSPCRVQPRSDCSDTPDTCYDCNDFANSASLSYQTHPEIPPDSTLSMYDNSCRIPNGNDNRVIDEWIRQMQNSIDPHTTPVEMHGDSHPDTLGDDSHYRELSSNTIDGIGSSQNIFARGRSRSFDDILLSSGLSSFNIDNAPLALFSANPGTGPMYSPNTFDIDALQHLPTISTGLDLGDAEARSRSDSSLSEVNRNTALNAFPDFGEMSMFYHHSNEGGRGSVRSLPDTLGYF